MQSEGAEKAERYRSGGLVTGVIGIVIVVGVIGFGLVAEDDGLAPWAYPLLLLAGVLAWAVLIRPAVVLHAEELELRNVLHSRWVPYPRITAVAISQVTAVHVGEDRYVGSGFGRSRRTLHRDSRALQEADQEGIRARHSLGWLVEDKIRRRADAETFAEPGPVRRTWAWPEVAAFAVLALATLVTALVA